MTPETLIRLGGATAIGFAVFHLAFWRLFGWREELARLGFINRQVMQILNLCLTFCFLIFAWVSLVHTDEMLTTGLGRSLLALIALLWLTRAAEQWWFFGIRHRGSLAFFVVFLAGAALYAWPWYAAVR